MIKVHSILSLEIYRLLLQFQLNWNYLGVDIDNDGWHFGMHRK